MRLLVCVYKCKSIGIKDTTHAAFDYIIYFHFDIARKSSVLSAHLMVYIIKHINQFSIIGLSIKYLSCFNLV